MGAAELVGGWDALGERLRIVFWLVAEGFGFAERENAPGVGRDAVDDPKTGRRHGHRGLEQPGAVVRGEPDAEHPLVAGALEAGADPDGDHIKTVAVVVEAAERLHGHLAHPLEG